MSILVSNFINLTFCIMPFFLFLPRTYIVGINWNCLHEMVLIITNMTAFDAKVTKFISARKHAYVILTPLNATFIQ